MSDDIVHQLRHWISPCGSAQLTRQAADEIDRLRTENEALRKRVAELEAGYVIPKDHAGHNTVLELLQHCEDQIRKYEDRVAELEHDLLHGHESGPIRNMRARAEQAEAQLAKLLGEFEVMTVRVWGAEAQLAEANALMKELAKGRVEAAADTAKRHMNEVATLTAQLAEIKIDLSHYVIALAEAHAITDEAEAQLAEERKTHGIAMGVNEDLKDDLRAQLAIAREALDIVMPTLEYYHKGSTAIAKARAALAQASPALEPSDGARALVAKIS